MEGAVIAELPEVHRLLENASAATWFWKDSRSLIGVTEISTPIHRPQYPDGDVLPESTLLFLYQPYEDAEKLHLLKTPEPAPGTVIRLEGVTEGGMLVLGIVEPKQYFGGLPKKVIGIFDVERP